MDAYHAVALAEGFADGTPEEVDEAWQYLIDTGMAWRLQGRFGRTAMQRIAQGLSKAATPDSRPGGDKPLEADPSPMELFPTSPDKPPLSVVLIWACAGGIFAFVVTNLIGRLS